MKKIILTTLLLVTMTFAFGQENMAFTKAFNRVDKMDAEGKVQTAQKIFIVNIDFDEEHFSLMGMKSGEDYDILMGTLNEDILNEEEVYVFQVRSRKNHSYCTVIVGKDLYIKEGDLKFRFYN